VSNYTKSTNFATKDNLTPGDPLKIVRGTEIDTEYNNIATAIATKTDNASAAITGGTITGITDLAVADGGTGASTAAAALNNLLPTQTGNANKYLQTDGTNATWDAVTLSTADITGTLPVANGGTGVTSSTGTGSVVLSNSPTLVTPTLGTPASGTATNLTGLPISTGVSGLGTGVATFLGTPSSANLASAVSDETGSGALVFANSPTLVTPALGTPSALVGTNITGTASGLTAGNVTTNANLTGAVTSVGNATSLGSFTSANLLGALTDETGTGSAVFATSPTLVTPILGTPTSATLTNATGLPIATGVSGLGTGIATALAVNTGSAGAPVLFNGALGTPSSGTVTNLTGTASININGTVGATTPAAGAFTTLSASSTLSVTGAGSIQGLTVGRGAGAVATNTAAGASALAANSTGERNIGVGSQALTANSTGVRNTVVGTFSYNGATACNYVTSVGHAAGNSATGDYNTFIGESAGGSMSSGTKNTILGRYNGNQGSLDIRTGSNYVVLSDGDGNPVAYTYNGATFCLQGAGYPQSGTGITFPATQSASSNANTLDDYEEGTFTPTAGISLTSATGKYTKIGRVVNFEMEVVFPVTSSTAGAGLTGLPFTASADNYPVAVWTNRGSSIFALVVASSTSVNLYYVTTGGIYDYVDFSNKSVKVSGTYFI